MLCVWQPGYWDWRLHPTSWTPWALHSQPEALVDSPPGPPSNPTSHQTQSGWRGTSWSPCCTWLTSGTSKHPPKKQHGFVPPWEAAEDSAFFWALVKHTSQKSPWAECQLQWEHAYVWSHLLPLEVLSFQDEESGAQRGEGIFFSCGHTAGEWCQGGGFLTPVPTLRSPHPGAQTTPPCPVAEIRKGMGCSKSSIGKGEAWWEGF